MNKTFIIAEAGVNHNGSIKLAKKLVKAAADAGADAVKFQRFKAENLCDPGSNKADYQKKNTIKNENQFQMLKKLELKDRDYYQLIKYSQRKKIEFLSSGFDLSDLVFLNNLKIKKFKIPSGEITNFLYLDKVKNFKKKIILSTGMSNIQEIKNAINILDPKKIKKKQITIMHCVSEYPTNIKSANLKVIQTLKKLFDYDIGYSDHTASTNIPALAVVLGAKIIEKHLTLDKKMYGPDHCSSLNPKEFKQMVEQIRIAEKALGNGKKIPTKIEKKNAKLVRKSIYIKKNINKGEKFSVQNLICKRPNIGISAENIKKFIGKRSKRKFFKNQLLK